ncbi:MAG TPA: AbrB/MazE/SpoVT family DNA-binding domain-containing protein [Bryobacteraceae bacterium]|nr:AbrB/MazE/SpoVT family DNA-binding domain-containing protein [Bryobacteraceae bacterium]
MATKTATTEERIGRVGQCRQVVIPRDILETFNLREGDFVAFRKQANGVLIKPKRLVDPDDVLSPKESALVRKAEREMRQGKYVTLDELRHDLDRPRSRRSRKTA